MSDILKAVMLSSLIVSLMLASAFFPIVGKVLVLAIGFIALVAACYCLVTNHE